MARPREEQAVARINDSTVTEEDLADLHTAICGVDHRTRGLVERVLRLPKWQQEDLQRRLPSAAGSAPEAGPDPAVARVTQLAVAGGVEDYDGPVPRNVVATTAIDLHGSTNAWFYVLKCSRCGAVAISTSGIGNTPVTWATERGWTTPSNGRRKWERCSCPRHR